jgi:hypothetical protein
LVRQPEETVPSQLSSIRSGLHLFGNEITDPVLVQKFVDLMAFYYFHLGRQQARLPEDRAAIMRYADLLDRPQATILDACSRLDYSISEDYRRRLRTAISGANSYRSKHRYQLSDFDLTVEDIQQRFTGPPMSLLETPSNPSVAGPPSDLITMDEPHDNTTAATT